MSVISAFSFAAISTQQTPKTANEQPQQAAGRAQFSSFEQLIASLAGGLSAGLNLDASKNESSGLTSVSSVAGANSPANSDKSADEFMNKLLAALQFLQETPDSKPPRPRHHYQGNDASQQAASAQAVPAASAVDSSAASDVAVSAPVASI